MRDPAVTMSAHAYRDLASQDAAPIGQFEVAIAGRTIALRHKSTGHVYEYLWFRTAPHLRRGLVREKSGAEVPARQICADARHAAISELMQARLLDTVAQRTPVSGRESGPR